MKLLVVESPRLVTPLHAILQRYQRDEWHVVATGGEWRGLPAMKGHEFADVVDVANGFDEHWIVHPSKQASAERLGDAIRSADEIVLATPPGREGEAAAWHVVQHFDLRGFRRAIIHEVTLHGVKGAIENARWINSHLVDAHRARAVADYLIGMEVSRLLWRIKASGTGRLQGCVLRMIAEREREARAAAPEPESTVVCDYAEGDNEWALRHDWELDEAFQRLLRKHDGNRDEQQRLCSESASEILGLARTCSHRLRSVDVRTSTEKPPVALATSSLLQIAAAKHGMRPRTTMAAAESLFERGFISSPRTESTHLPPEVIAGVRSYIGATWSKLMPDTPVGCARRYDNGRGQTATHPTVITRAPVGDLRLEEALVYEIVIERTLQAQACPSTRQHARVVVDLEGSGRQLTGTVEVTTKPGWREIDWDLNELKSQVLPTAVGERLVRRSAGSETWDPRGARRHTDASIIEAMERGGLGRPSTYAKVVEMLERREYVLEREGELVTTPLGRRVDEFLGEHFDELFREDFTANTERALGAIAGGRLGRKKFLDAFYRRFEQMRAAAEKAA